MTQKKTALGGGDYVRIAGGLITLGILPKSLRPAVGAIGTVLLIVSIGKRLGVL